MNEDRQLLKDRAGNLAGFIHAMRSDWDMPGIMAALRKAADRPSRPDAYQIALAAIRASADTTNRTPAVIALDGQHWRPWTADDAAETRATPTNSTLEGRCKRGHWIVAGENHVCAPIGDPKAGAAAARQALAAARAAHTPTKETQ